MRTKKKWCVNIWYLYSLTWDENKGEVWKGNSDKNGIGSCQVWNSFVPLCHSFVYLYLILSYLYVIRSYLYAIRSYTSISFFRISMPFVRTFMPFVRTSMRQCENTETV